MVTGIPDSCAMSTPTGDVTLYSGKNASSDTAVIAKWCSNTVCRPKTTTSSRENVSRRGFAGLGICRVPRNQDKAFGMLQSHLPDRAKQFALQAPPD